MVCRPRAWDADVLVPAFRLRLCVPFSGSCQEEEDEDDEETEDMITPQASRQSPGRFRLSMGGVPEIGYVFDVFVYEQADHVGFMPASAFGSFHAVHALDPQD